MMLTLQDLLRTRTAQPQLNKAMYFNGVNAYINVASSSSLALSSQFTLVGWFLFPPGISGAKGVVQKNQQVGDYDYMLYLSLAGYPSVYFKNPAGTAFYVMYTVDHRDNSWHYWTGTFDGRYLKMYTDATLRVTTDTGGTTVRTSSTPLTIGYGWNYYVKMFSSQVLIYSRALSSSEIIHNMLNPNNPIRDGLVLWLDARACDTSKNICYDLSGNGNHGTMYNVQIVTLSNPVRVGGRL